MLGSYRHFCWSQDNQRLLWLKLDQADSDANVLADSVMTELDQILDELEKEPPSALIIQSGKPAGFIAGADVHAFENVTSSEQALALSERGQRLTNRLEQLKCTKIALIHGYCLGGGLELALACDYRIASDDPTTALGLPEVRLGIHPGYGGVMRSIRVMGPVAALQIMLSGRQLSAKQARGGGLVDAVTPRHQLENAARYYSQKTPARQRATRLQRLPANRLLRGIVTATIRRKTSRMVRAEHYPSPFALIDLWSRHGGDEQALLAAEARSVAKLATSDTARNLLRIFLLREALKKTSEQPHSTKHVHVIGAGAMGGDIALWCARQGLDVSLQDAEHPRLAGAMARFRTQLTASARTRAQASSIMDRILPDIAGDGLKSADLVIEAIPEKLDWKLDLYRSIEPLMKPGAVLASNTSSLSLTALADGLDRPDRFLALHFFNPVSKLPLVELAPTASTNQECTDRARKFILQIGKLPLQVRDEPGFLVNRLLMPYLLEAARMAEEGHKLEEIDQAALDFGMPAGPITLADQIGLDVCLSVATGLGKDMGFETPALLKEHVANRRLGRKTGQGFYRYQQGKPLKSRAKSPAEDLQDRLLLPLLNSAVACNRSKVVESADMLDAGAVFGAGFAPFRGGPMRHIESVGRQALERRLSQLETRFGSRFRPDPGWTES